MYKAVLSGFETIEQVKAFLKWYEGQGEQDEGLFECLRPTGITSAMCDIRTGMITHSDGVEYKLDLFHPTD